MRDDDEICLCFHVTKRKVIQYIRAERPKIASQLSQCYGAGTGCGWCRPFLKQLLEQPELSDLSAQSEQPELSDSATTTLPDAASYADQRQRYQKND